MARAITGDFNEFERLLRFADNDFFNISMTFGVLNRIAGRSELFPPLCRTEGEFLIVRNAFLVTTVVGLGRLYFGDRNSPCLPTLMQFFENDRFVSTVREKYVGLARTRRPELFLADQARYKAKAIDEFKKRKLELDLQWKGIVESGQIKAIGRLRNTRYAHSVVKKETGKRLQIPDLKFEDLEKVVDETDRLFAAIIILVYGAGAVSERSFSAPVDLLNAPTVWWEYGPFS